VDSLLKKLVVALIPMAIAAAIEARITLARVEQSVHDIDKRVQNLEDSRDRTALVQEYLP